MPEMTFVTKSSHKTQAENLATILVILFFSSFIVAEADIYDINPCWYIY